MPERLSQQYSAIKDFAKRKALKLRAESNLPTLPSEEELEETRSSMWLLDLPLIDAVIKHLYQKGVSPGNGFDDHIEQVAVLGAYVSQLECEARGIPQVYQPQLIQRWRGYGKDHMIEGSRASSQILNELGIQDEFLVKQVLLHDELEVQARNDERFDIPFFSHFAVDHLNWGLEWEQKKWDVLEAKSVPIGKAIIDYRTKHLDLLQSSNLQQTTWGRNIVRPYLQYGIDIARSVEKAFEI